MRQLAFGVSFFMIACASAQPSQEAPAAAAPAATPLPSAGLEKPYTDPLSDEKILTADEEADKALRAAAFENAMDDAAAMQTAFQDVSERVAIDGNFSQGGLAFGQVEPGSAVRLDGEDVFVGADGRFVIGFGRDAKASSLLLVTLPDGETVRRALEIADRDFPVQRIDGLDQSKVSGFTEEQLAKIAVDSDKKKAARAKTESDAFWADGFRWPTTGPISGVFGSQRILNGEPKRPHSGVDVAAPTGTLVRAPAAGVITLAESDMYFEGGLILLDHGHWLESAFLHLSRLDVAPGQRVEKGDILGAVGATGRVTGPHLHWSMKWQGQLVDPQLVAGPMPKAAD